MDYLLYKLYSWIIDNVFITLISVALTVIAVAIFVKTHGFLIPALLIALWIIPLTFRLMGLNKYGNAYEPVVIVKDDEEKK